jgi:flagellar hook-basal body complex protein FliE
MGAIGSILGAGMAGLNATAATASTAAPTGAGATGAVGTAGQVNKSGGDFGNVVANALDSLQGVQSKSDGLAVKAATGDLNDVHDYMIAASEASLATEFTVAVRNRAVEAFNDIMKMQI